MLTEKDYCDYETCVALKELGYKEKSHAYYDSEDNVGLLYNTYWACDVAPCQYFDVLESHNTDTEHEIDAPTLYEAQKWLRENHNLHIDVGYNPSLSWYYYHLWNNQDEIAEGEAFPTYEDALNTAVYMAVEHLKNDNLF